MFVNEKLRCYVDCRYIYITYICIHNVVIYTEGAKSQYPYVGLNSSVTECPIVIILSGMTYYHHWFEEFVKSKIFVFIFFK